MVQRAVNGVGSGGIKTLRVYSASEDTVSFAPVGGTGTLIYQVHTNAQGYADVDLPIGTYNATSSIARDSLNLDNYYTKQVTVGSGVNELYVMPDHTLYWYGYKSNDLEIVISTNGWANPGGSQYYIDPTFATNPYRTCIGAGAPQFSGIGTKNTIKASKLHAVAVGTSSSYKGAWIEYKPSKATASSTASVDFISNTQGVWKYGVLNVSTTDDIVASIESGSDRTADVYAFWYE